jgi:hypothetical protein
MAFSPFALAIIPFILFAVLYGIPAIKNHRVKFVRRYLFENKEITLTGKAALIAGYGIVISVSLMVFALAFDLFFGNSLAKLSDILVLILCPLGIIIHVLTLIIAFHLNDTSE